MAVVAEVGHGCWAGEVARPVDDVGHVATLVLCVAEAGLSFAGFALKGAVCRFLECYFYANVFFETSVVVLSYIVDNHSVVYF